MNVEKIKKEIEKLKERLKDSQQEITILPGHGYQYLDDSGTIKEGNNLGRTLDYQRGRMGNIFVDAQEADNERRRQMIHRQLSRYTSDGLDATYYLCLSETGVITVENLKYRIPGLRFESLEMAYLARDSVSDIDLEFYMTYTRKYYDPES